MVDYCFLDILAKVGFFGLRGESDGFGVKKLGENYFLWGNWGLCLRDCGM
jgi:hypothetical protein